MLIGIAVGVPKSFTCLSAQGLYAHFVYEILLSIYLIRIGRLIKFVESG